MKRLLIGLIAVVALVATACGTAAPNRVQAPKTPAETTAPAPTTAPETTAPTTAPTTAACVDDALVQADLKKIQAHLMKSIDFMRQSDFYGASGETYQAVVYSQDIADLVAPVNPDAAVHFNRAATALQHAGDVMVNGVSGIQKATNFMGQATTEVKLGTAAMSSSDWC